MSNQLYRAHNSSLVERQTTTTKNLNWWYWWHEHNDQSNIEVRIEIKETVDNSAWIYEDGDDDCPGNRK